MNRNSGFISRFNFISELLVIADSLNFEVKYCEVNSSIEFKAFRNDLIIEIRNGGFKMRHHTLLEIKRWHETTDKGFRFEVYDGSSTTMNPDSGGYETVHYGYNVLAHTFIKNKPIKEVWDFSVFLDFIKNHFKDELRSKSIESVIN